MALVNAALVAGLYPKILTVREEKIHTPNNKEAFFHPSSVNFRKKPSDLDTNFLTYFTLMYEVYSLLDILFSVLTRDE
jgi:ATP-dependent RNA helicase DHX29